MTGGDRRRRSMLVTLAAACLSLPAAFTPVAGAVEGHSGTVTASLARSLTVRDSGRLHLAHSGGEDITEEGRTTGTLPGKVVAQLVVGATVEVKFTIYTSAGTISGQGSGKLKGRPEEPSFAGDMTISRGTGRFKHAHGRGGFYGTLNRSSYAMVVQTTGTLSF